MIDIYSGDPKTQLTENGMRIPYKGGQPVMDQGIENQAHIDLFTRKKGINRNRNGWVGNHLFRRQEEKIGSDYIETVESTPITLNGFAIIEQAAKQALRGELYGNVTPVATNPDTGVTKNVIRINAPSGVLDLTTEVGQRWRAQVNYPANERI